MGFVNSNGVGLAGPGELARQAPDRQGGQRDVRERPPMGQGDPRRVHPADDPGQARATPSRSRSSRTCSSGRRPRSTPRWPPPAADSGSLVAMDVEDRGRSTRSPTRTASTRTIRATWKGGSLSSAILDVFEPGSAGKVVHDVRHPGQPRRDADVAVPGAVRVLPWVSKETFHDSHEHAVENLTLTGILAESSNVGTVMVGAEPAGADAVRLPARSSASGPRPGSRCRGSPKGLLHFGRLDWAAA